VEQVDTKAFGRDIELVIFAEELCAPATDADGGRGGSGEGGEAEAGALFRGFVEDRLEDLGKGGRSAWVLT